VGTAAPVYTATWVTGVDPELADKVAALESRVQKLEALVARLHLEDE
jgi:hypothetical protein